MLKIEKFVGGERRSTFKAPHMLVGFANRLLPESAHAELKVRGIDLREIAAARKDDRPFSISVWVREGGVDKKVVISSS